MANDRSDIQDDEPIGDVNEEVRGRADEADKDDEDFEDVDELDETDEAEEE